MDIDAFDATQDLGLSYGANAEEEVEKKKVAKLITAAHQDLSTLSYPVYEGINLIGRDGSSDIHIKLQSLSKKHACIEVTDGDYMVYDFDSKNKTLLGERLLKPYVRYSLKDSDVLTFGDLKCKFKACPSNEDLDETRSLSGSETGSESLIPEGEEEILHLSDDERKSVGSDFEFAGLRKDGATSRLSDYIIMPTQHEQDDRERQNTSRLSDYVIMPTQEASSRSTFVKNTNDIKRDKDAICEDTDSEPEDSEERGNTPAAVVIEQTPGFALGKRTKSCISDSLVEGENDTSVVVESPYNVSVENGHINKFIANVVFRTPPSSLHSSGETNAGSGNTSNDEEEEMPSTYVFGMGDLSASDEDYFEGSEGVVDNAIINSGDNLCTEGREVDAVKDSDENIRKDVAAGIDDDVADISPQALGTSHDNGDVRPTTTQDRKLDEVGDEKVCESNVEKTTLVQGKVLVDNQTDVHDLDDESQVIGYTTSSSVKLPTPVTNFRIDDDDDKFVENSEDMATQPYQYTLKTVLVSPTKEDVEMKVHNTGCTLPGGSFHKYEEEVSDDNDDLATQMYAKDEMRNVGAPNSANGPVISDDLDEDCTQVYVKDEVPNVGAPNGANGPVTSYDFDEDCTQVYVKDEVPNVSAPNDANDPVSNDDTDDDCTQMYQVAQVLSDDDHHHGGGSVNKNMVGDDAETQLYVDVVDQSCGNMDQNMDIYDDVATQCYSTDDHGYDDISTQLYAVDSFDNNKKTDVQSKDMDNIEIDLERDAIANEIEQKNADEAHENDQVVKNCETSSNKEAVELCNEGGSDNEITGNVLSEGIVSGDVEDLGDKDKKGKANSRKRKSVRFHMDEMESSDVQPESVDEDKNKEDKEPEIKRKGKAKQKSRVPRAKKGAALKRTSPSIFELLGDGESTPKDITQEDAKISKYKEDAVKQYPKRLRGKESNMEDIGETKAEASKVVVECDTESDDAFANRPTKRSTKSARNLKGKSKEADNMCELKEGNTDVSQVVVECGTESNDVIQNHTTKTSKRSVRNLKGKSKEADNVCELKETIVLELVAESDDVIEIHATKRSVKSARNLKGKSKVDELKETSTDVSEVVVEQDAEADDVFENHTTKRSKSARNLKGKSKEADTLCEVKETSSSRSSRLKKSSKSNSEPVSEIEFNNNSNKKPVLHEEDETARSSGDKTSLAEDNLKSEPPKKLKGKLNKVNTRPVKESLSIKTDTSRSARSKRSAKSNSESVSEGEFTGKSSDKVNQHHGSVALSSRDLVEEETSSTEATDINHGQVKKSVPETLKLVQDHEDSKTVENNEDIKIKKSKYEKKTKNSKDIQNPDEVKVPSTESVQKNNTRSARSNRNQKSNSGTVSESSRGSLAKPKVIFTGLSDKSLEKIVTDLGGEVVDNVSDATHLVTDKVRRTVKFLCAVARGLPIVHSEWLMSSKASKAFIVPQRHILTDDAAERQYKFQLHRTLEKAAETPLFTDKKIYVTKNVKPERKLLKEMVESAGGSYITRLPKSPSEDIIVVSCIEDEKEYVKLVDKGFITCTKEIILAGILRQQLDTERYLISNQNDLLNVSQMSLSSDSGIKDDTDGSANKRKAKTVISSRKEKRRK